MTKRSGICVVVIALSIALMTSLIPEVSFAETENVMDKSNFNVEQEFVIDLNEDGSSSAISLFDGSLSVDNGDPALPNAIAVYKGYWKVHSWTGNKLTFGLGITCTHSILLRYQADIEIWDANVLNEKLLSSGKMDISGIGGVKNLIDEKTMNTGSTKQIRVLVKNIRVSTTAGPISRSPVGTVLKRP